MNFEEIKNEILKEMEEFVYCEEELAMQAKMSFITGEDGAPDIISEEEYERTYGSRQGQYTIKDYYALSKDMRMELIDGYLFRL